jgi:hypothetical protein
MQRRDVAGARQAGRRTEIYATLDCGGYVRLSAGGLTARLRAKARPLAGSGRSADLRGGFLDGLVDVLRADVEFLGDVLAGLQAGPVHGLLQLALADDDEGGLPWSRSSMPRSEMTASYTSEGDWLAGASSAGTRPGEQLCCQRAPTLERVRGRRMVRLAGP